MTRRPQARRHALAALVLAAGGMLVSCSSSEGATDGATADAGSSGTTASTTAATASSAPTAADGIDGLRGVRYCEVLLLTQGDEGFTAAVWNTMGMSECPDEQWAALDAQAIAEERGAVAAILNGPRYWALDAITTDLREGAPETSFGDVGMFQAATVALGDDLPSQAPYTERGVARDTVFGFDAGSEVYELVAPDGTAYVMQSWSQIVDADLAEDDLADLGERLQLPEGWQFRVRTLEQALEVRDEDGVATIVQDELQNTYQLVDAPA